MARSPCSWHKPFVFVAALCLGSLLARLTRRDTVPRAGTAIREEKKHALDHWSDPDDEENRSMSHPNFLLMQAENAEAERSKFSKEPTRSDQPDDDENRTRSHPNFILMQAENAEAERREAAKESTPSRQPTGRQGPMTSTSTTSGTQHLRTTCKARAGNYSIVDPTGDFATTQFAEYFATVFDALVVTNETDACEVTLLVRQAANGTIDVTALSVGGRTGAYLVEVWTRALKRVFMPRCGRMLPGSVVFGLQGSREEQTPDFAEEEDLRNRCFAHSSPGGDLSVSNFLAVQAMGDDVDESYNYLPKPSLPFDERGPIPIWRGTPWGEIDQIRHANDIQGVEEAAAAFYDVVPGAKHARIPLVRFSLGHPDLLDARFSKLHATVNTSWDEFAYNESLSAERMLPTDPIERVRYYNGYRAAIVMGGHGAAFRLADHLAQGTAVILQDFMYEEWFTGYMTPRVEYIPLRRDLSNLNETLLWVRDNPTSVREIAERGRLFYEKYLSYDMMEEFMYELLFRLAKAQEIARGV